MQPFKIEFDNVNEVRHGSPFSIAEIRFVGQVHFKLENNFGWQDIQCWTSDFAFFALVKWDILEDNEPGFRIILFDSKKGQLKQSDRISGCCKHIELNTDLHVDCDIHRLTSMPTEKKSFGSVRKKLFMGKHRQ